ncbi:MAG TPA: SseB family protein [Chthoniobacter sp.]|jgi:hypothetical protein
MFGFFKKRPPEPKPSEVKPPVDLNTPVENPAVVAAILSFAADRTPATQDALTRALRAANFLVPILTDEMHTTPSGEGKTTIQAGSRIKILTCSDAAGAVHLPLFTDWPSIRRWTDQPVSTLVMTAKEAFEFGASDNHAGAVVNPGENALPLNKQLLAYLLNTSEKA